MEFKNSHYVIEFNMKTNSTAKNSQFVHKKGSDFAMNKAYTYVSISASANLHMLLMSNELFQRGLNTEGADSPDEVVAKGSTIKYFGLSGY